MSAPRVLVNPDHAQRDRHELRGGCTLCWRGLYIGGVCSVCGDLNLDMRGTLKSSLGTENPLAGTTTQPSIYPPIRTPSDQGKCVLTNRQRTEQRRLANRRAYLKRTRRER